MVFAGCCSVFCIRIIFFSSDQASSTMDGPLARVGSHRLDHLVHELAVGYRAPSQCAQSALRSSSPS
ncbi:hypothetical protein PF005_g5188 [Phytophthora fragariae]|uniref:Secreted protein n=1 Tax=Phytophthora fragariae TaxID=53985 RepID=A0A6A3UMB2_9STRA|nr:hypothetical protein PF003_g36259 [Phytophthora fragariae]KAE8944875.1 hypothetical protein PF009_g5454 [Phytophthora fragariae]KAE9023125.1 hypothetical protein PF011_g4145 [Phytophthora fragariae]KAE9111575.1 hypothetical protein PF010_g10756 [Phytophthora fragariae]KAE9128840.1 hypothetical protein PF007_g5131 [Phytophthora fragariae]